MKYGIQFKRIDGTWVCLGFPCATKEERNDRLQALRAPGLAMAPSPLQYRPFRILETADIERRGGARALRELADKIASARCVQEAFDALLDRADELWPEAGADRKGERR